MKAANDRQGPVVARSRHQGAVALLALLPAVIAGAAFGAEFNTAISPPRFELRASAGDTLRETVRISNLGDTPAELAVRTADWSLSEDGGFRVHDDNLQPGSCRPWTRIERHRTAVAPQRERRYRFEVHVPEDTGRGECRFAIVFQQPEESAGRMSMGNVSLPVLGQVAIIVYVNVGGASPELHVRDVVRSGPDNDQVALVMENTGDAHGRPQGVVKLTGPEDGSQEFIVAPVAILPGMTRTVPLWLGHREGTAAAPGFPASVRGTVEWRDGSHRVDATVE